MNNDEARKILAERLKHYRAMLYSELVELMGEPQILEATGDSGAKYQLEVEACWDHEAGKDVRVIGSIDDGGWRAFSPLTDSFIMRRDGTFVDE